MYFKTVVNFYVQKRHKSGDELCLSVCQVQIMTDTHTKHTHILTLELHTLTQLVTIKVQNRSVGYNGQKKKKHSNVVREKGWFHWSLELWCARFEAIISFQTQM